jgi:hypothetical protein
MSFDKVWTQTNGQDNNRLERHAAEEAGRGQEFLAEAEMLRAQGHYVTLPAGENCLIDELFLFRDAAAATEFYERGFAAWEKFLEGEAEGFGFDSVRLYEFGRLVASKSCPPSMRLDVGYE